MMESVEELEERARRSIEVAEQMLLRTYPVVQDPKLILAVAGDVYFALMGCIEAVMLQAGMDSSDDFSSRLEAFKALASKQGFGWEEFSLVEDVHRIVSEHESSPVEFPRKDRLVICDEKYHCDVISVDDMKNYLFKARLFVEKARIMLRQ
jgi:hypothetical protein